MSALDKEAVANISTSIMCEHRMQKYIRDFPFTAFPQSLPLKREKFERKEYFSKYRQEDLFNC
jgi:hypothetical protein